MIRLDKALHAWGTPEFKATFEQEVAQLDAGQLPLQEGLSTGNYVTASPFTVMVKGVTESGDSIRVRAGIFYHSVIAGCSCDNDPTPTSENTEYCEVHIEIDKATAAASVTLAG